MKLKDYISYVSKEFDNHFDGYVKFELELDSELNICAGGGQKATFTVTNKNKK